MVFDLAVCQVQIVSLLLLELSKLLRDCTVISFCLVLVKDHAVAPDAVQSVHYNKVMATRNFVFQASSLSHFDQQGLSNS